MSLVTLLRDSFSAVEEANLPPELRPVAFAQAFEYLRSQSEYSESTTSNVADAVADTDNDGDPMEWLSNRLNIDMELLKRVYYSRNGQIGVQVAARRLARQKSRATHQLAVLTLAGEHAAGTDWVSPNVIRDVCTRYGKLDSTNFSTHIRQLDEFLVIDGRNKSRQLQLNEAGWEKGTEIIHELVGSDS